MTGSVSWRLRFGLLVGVVALIFASMGPVCAPEDECGGCSPGFECQFCFNTWQCVPEGAEC